MRILLSLESEVGAHYLVTGANLMHIILSWEGELNAHYLVAGKRD